MVLEVKKHVCSGGSSAGDLLEKLIRTLHPQVDILGKKKDSDEQSRVHLVSIIWKVSILSIYISQ